MEDLEEDGKFIVDETLDFGAPSLSDSREEKDTAMLVTPEKPQGRGLSHRRDLNAVAPAPQAVSFSLGRLSPEKLEEVLHEANLLAAQLKQCALQERESSVKGRGPLRGKPRPRRKTFELKDSPFQDLLPTISSLGWSTPSPSSLTPRLRGSDRKGSTRALRMTLGKRPTGVMRESPTCSLLLVSKSPALSPLTRSMSLSQGKAGPSARPAASPLTSIRPASAPQPSASSTGHLSRPPGAAAEFSPRLPVPSAIPRPPSRMPLSSQSVPPGRSALAPDSTSTRKGLPGPSMARHRVSASQPLNLPVTGSARGGPQLPRKAAVPGPTR